MSSAIDDPTSASLLKKLRQPAVPNAPDAWRRFVQLYTPLLFHWAHRLGATAEDAADLVQEVFTVLVREMPTFRYDPAQRFRGWLWTILLNKWRDRVRQQAIGPSYADPGAMEAVAAPDNVEEFAEEEYRTYLIGRAMEVMQAELPPQDWHACHEYLIRGRPAAEVARELGLSVNQVYLAKSRILRRLRVELEGLLD
jgi:RNA polymerase sigma-70 factor (ECF subfamily)